MLTGIHLGWRLKLQQLSDRSDNGPQISSPADYGRTKADHSQSTPTRIYCQVIVMIDDQSIKRFNVIIWLLTKPFIEKQKKVCFGRNETCASSDLVEGQNIE